MDETAPALRVTPLFTGQEVTDPNGTVTVVTADLVQLEFLMDGEPVAALQQAPTNAIALARLLTEAAGTLINNQVDDTGKKPTALERLAAFNQAWTGKA